MTVSLLNAATLNINHYIQHGHKFDVTVQITADLFETKAEKRSLQV